MFIAVLVTLISIASGYLKSPQTFRSYDIKLRMADERFKDANGRLPGDAGYRPIIREAPTDFAAYQAEMKAKKASKAAETSSASTKSTPGPLTELCQISKEACDTLAPMIQAFYSKISGDTSKLKSDASFFTIADGIVQHMFIEHLFKGNKFGQIVGEEDETKVNIVTKPFMVDDLQVPEEFNEIIEKARDSIKLLSERIDSKLYKHITVFVDPIDGTREFATGQGEHCSILIGYNDQQGKPVAGIIYRPITQPATWAAGAKSENCYMARLDACIPPVIDGMLVTDGVVSKFISKLIDELNYERIPSLASGNRVLMLLEGKGGAYMRDTGGNAKWDTSGPQAVLEAHGGCLAKLSPYIKDKSLESYTYLKSDHNLDFEAGVAVLTLSNAKDKSTFKKGETHKVDDVHSVKAYSNLQGLVALDKANLGKIDTIYDAIMKVKNQFPPSYT